MGSTDDTAMIGDAVSFHATQWRPRVIRRPRRRKSDRLTHELLVLPRVVVASLEDESRVEVVERRRSAVTLIAKPAILYCATMTGTLFDVKIDRDDPALLHEQVAAQIRQAIADGEAMPGDRLPPARHLAAVMGVNTNTVLRALRMLRDEGLLELRQGHGIRVTGTPERSALLDKVAELVQLGRRSGYTRAELMRMIESVP